MVGTNKTLGVSGVFYQRHAAMSAHIREDLDLFSITYNDQWLIQKLDCSVIADVGQLVDPSYAMPVLAQHGFSLVVKICRVSVKPP